MRRLELSATWFCKSLLVGAFLVQSLNVGAASAGQKVAFDFHYNLIWVSVATPSHSRPLQFLLDTGASVSAIDRTLLPTMGLRGRKVTVEAVGGTTEGVWPIKFKGEFAKEMLPSRLLAVDLSALSKAAGRQVNGIIGADFFAGRIVRINYADKTVQIVPRTEFQAGLEAITLKVRKRNGVLLLPVAVGDSGRKWVRLDTGCNSSLHWVRNEGTPSRANARLSIAGIGETQSDNAEVLATIGGRTSRLDAVLHEEPIFHGESGLLGNSYLSNFIVTVDAKEANLHLESYSY
jgi:hypothetical protein